jgi:hypothetical protein
MGKNFMASIPTMTALVVGGFLLPRLEYQVERCLRRSAEMPKATSGDHLLESFFSGLGTQSESNFLGQRSRSAQEG